MKKNVVIVGSSGHAKVIIDIFEKEGEYTIIGLLDVYKEKGKEIAGHKIIGEEKDLPTIIKQYPDCGICIAIGDNWVRQKVKKQIDNILPTAKYVSVIHPSSQIGKDVVIGKGTTIMAGAIINAYSRIGDFTIINTNAVLDHDCVVHDYSSVGPGAAIGGNVIVDKYSVISIGATIIHGVKIGTHSIIGAGAVLTKDCGDNLIMYGIPAREIRKRSIGEIYL